MGNASLAIGGVAAMSALGVLAFFVGIYLLVGRPGDMRGRLESYAGAAAEQKGREARERREGSGALVQRLNRFLSGQSAAQRLGLHLAQANLRMSPLEFVLLMLGCAAVGAVIGYALRGYAISAVAGGVLGFAIPWALLERRRVRRLHAFQGQLLDVLSLMVGSLRSGHGLLNAMGLVGKELGAPASEEFGRVVREVGFGLSQVAALDNLVRRMDSRDLELIVTAINIGHEVGGDLSQVLEQMAETIRERIRLHGEIRVLTTQQRLTTYLLVALPLVLGGVLALLNPSWIMRLFKPGWVRLLPALALALEAVGFVIARSLTRIDV